MSKIGRVFKEAKSNWLAMSLLPAPYNKHKIKYWFDSIFCLVKYGALADDYISMAFYSKKEEERSKYVTSGNKRLFYKNFYDDEAREVLAKKNLFSKRKTFKICLKAPNLFFRKCCIGRFDYLFYCHDEISCRI